MQECGLTLDALGERVGLSASAVSSIESGKREAKVSTHTALADALECQLFEPCPILPDSPMMEEILMIRPYPRSSMCCRIALDR